VITFHVASAILSFVRSRSSEPHNIQAHGSEKLHGLVHVKLSNCAEQETIGMIGQRRCSLEEYGGGCVDWSSAHRHFGAST